MTEPSPTADEPVPVGLPFAHFEISTDATGRGRCVINGHDIGHQVEHLAVVISPNSPEFTQVQLRMRGEPLVEGDGVVHVILDQEQAAVPVAQAVLAFLDRVDSSELEGLIASGPMNRGIGTAALAALKQLAAR